MALNALRHESRDGSSLNGSSERKRSAAVILSLAPLILSLTLAACSDTSGPDSASFNLAVLSGDRQTGVQNTPLSDPIVLQITRQNGSAVVGARLTFSMGDGSGALMEADSLTDAEGRAVFRWELGEAWENTLSVSLLEHQGVRTTVRAWARYRPAVPEAVDDGWETGSLSSAGLADEPLVRMMDSLRAGHYPEVHSVLVVRNHRLVHEAYFPGHDFGYGRTNFLGTYVEWDRNRPHNTHSATKSVISTLVGLAIDGGFVPNEEEPVFHYFPDYAEYGVGGKEAITIRDMLTMTSGLEWPEWNTPIGGGLSPIEEFNNSPDPIGYVLAKPLVDPPGTVFNYNGGTVNVLCQLVSRAAGTRVEEFAGERLFWPMGVTNFSFPTHYTGMTVCHGDIYITPRDLAKYGQLYLDGGVWNGTRILSEEWIRKSVSPLVSVRNFNLYWASDYGYLWWLNDYTVDGKTYSTYKALGWGGQEVWVVPEEEMVVIFTGANYTTNPPTDEIMTRFVFPALTG